MYIFTLIYLIFFLPFYGQAQYSLQPLDSLVIKEATYSDIYSLKKHGNTIFFPSYQNLKLFDTKGGLISDTKFFNTRKLLSFKRRGNEILESLSFQPYKGYYIEMRGDKLVFYSAGGYTLWCATILQEKKYQNFSYKGTEIHFYPDIFQLPPMIARHNLMIITNRAVPDRKEFDKQYRKNQMSFLNFFHEYDTLKFLPELPDIIIYDINPPYPLEYAQAEKHKYQDGQVVTNDNKGKRLRWIRSIQIKDDFVQTYWKNAKQGKFIFEASQKFIDYDSVHKQIYFARLHSPQITIVNTEGKIIKSFGKRGKHLQPTDTLNYIDKEEFTKFVIEKKNITLGLKNKYIREKYNLSPVYLCVYHDISSQKTYRVYQAPLRYQQSEYRKIFWDNSEKSDSLLYIRPTYLQIYDSTHNLIYDEPVPSPFHIIEAKGDEIWAVTGETSAGLKITKYKVRRKGE